MAYEKFNPTTYSNSTWSTGDPITQERMNKIETGINQVTQDVIKVDANADALYDSIAEIDTIARNAGTTASNAQTLAQSVSNELPAIDQKASHGESAYSALSAGITEFNAPSMGLLMNTIKTYINTENSTQNSTISSHTTDIGALQGVIQNAIIATRNNAVVASSPIETLAARILNLYDTIGAVDSRVTTIGQNTNDTADMIRNEKYSSRLDALDGGKETVYSGKTVPEINQELNDAHTSTAIKTNNQDTVYNSLDERLEASESKLVTVENEVVTARGSSANLNVRLSQIDGSGANTQATRISNLENEVTTARGESDNLNARLNTMLTTNDVKNNLQYVSTGADDRSVLHAAQGKALNDRLTLAEQEIANAHRELGTDPETGNAIVDTLDKRFDELEESVAGIDNILDGALVSSIVRTPGENDGDPDTDTTYANLDARLEAIESHAAAVRTDVNTIAGELSMIDNESIVNTNTRVDSIEGEITAAHRTNDDTLNARFGVIELSVSGLNSTITNAETGLAKTKEIADEALGKANAAAVATEVTSALAGKASTQSVSDLSDRVTTLETAPKSATVVIDNVTYDNDGNPSNIGTTPSTDVDYLLKKDDKYYYWKYIKVSSNPDNYSWEQISGGNSSSGNTSGMDLTAEEYAELESYNENTDYYVTRNDGIHHYRYIPDTTSGEGLMEVEIGITENYNIGIGTVTETVEDEEVDKTYLYLYKFAPGQESTITDETSLPLPADRGTLVRRVELKGTGGGIGAYEQIRIQPAAGQSTVFTTVEGNTTPIPLNLQGYKRDQLGYVATTLVITIQSRERGSDTWRTYTQGEKEVSVTSEGVANFSTIDISPLLVLNKTIEIKVTAADKNDANLTNSSVIFSATKVELNLTSTFNQSAPYTTSTVAFNYSYTGSGLNKTLYIYLDDTLLTTRTLGTGIGNGSYNIDMSEKIAGTYNLKAYFVTDDNNTSNTLNYSIMYIPAGEALGHPIVGISVPETSITEGDILTINYSAYTQNADQTQEVLFEIFEDGSSTAYTSKKATNVNNNSPSSILFLDYPVPADGVESISITVRATASNDNQESYSVEQVIAVMRYSDTSINFDPIETNLIYEFDPITHTNNDENRAEFTYSPHSGMTYTTTLEDFNWVSNGYLGDEALTFNGDAVMHINVPVLTTNVAGTDINDTPTSHGRTIEFEYEVNSVTDINAPIITYFNNSNITEDTDTSTKTGVGFEITPQNCYLISEAKSVVTDKKGFIHNEDDIAAAYLSEGSRLRVSFVIEAVGTHQTGAGNNAQTVNIYINGQYANSCPYDGASELFTIPADADCKITIGNDSSILKLYDVRIYNRGLTEAEILQNYVTSPLLRRDKLARIRENDLLTANQQEIDYYKARQYYNCLLITGNLSPAKSEKVSCGLIFTQPNGEGGFDEKFRCMDTFPDGSYTSQNAVQGTSSVKFPVKNYKVYLTSGYELDKENKPKAVKYKYALEPGRVKESTFCWKGDYMSSDHANTFNANWADALETRIDGANHVQNSVYGFRCLLFYRPDAEESTPIVLIGDGTLNNDKGNTKTFQLEDSSDIKDSNDTRSQKWEFKNNTETPCLFQNDNLISLVNGEEDYTAATEAFESTYPDEGDLEDVGVRPNYNHLQILLSWVLRRANYWDETDESARAAKKAIFKNEFTRHFNMDHMLLYYLFCEFTAMTDNRAKNMFIRCDNIRDEEIKNMSGATLFSGNTIPDNQSDWYKYLTGTDAYKTLHYTDIDWENSTFGVWTPILYDLDSCYGVENSGYLQVPYYANWNYRDVADTKYLFNGYGSILWLMFEDSFANEIRTMAQTIYANGANGEPGLNYNSFYKYHITDNALKFPPVIINQDMNKKYLNPWINGLPDPEDATRMIYNAQYKYLQRGSRTDQKVGFIERRSRMLYSKYLTTQFIANEASVNFRCGNAGAKDPITLIAGTACYPAIQFSDTSTQSTTTVQQYANTGDSVSFTPGEDGMGFSDTVYIRGASMLTGITGIGGYMPYEINLSGGRNLKQLILGSSTIINTQVSSSALSGLDACSILEDLNIENFNGSSFTTLNLASNRLLKNLYATGANNLGTCSFANGGIIENIELGTGLTNLTLRNQTRIETLKFGGSDIILANNISKINTIFVEGVSNAAMDVIQDIFKLRLYALKNQLDNGVAAGEAIALGGGVRISGLNMTITCRDSNNNYLEEADLLDLLINKEVMLGKGLTYDGKLSNTSYPYLSGTITINRGQDKKIDILRSMYPNLTVIENNSITSYLVTYQYNNTSTILYVNDNDIAPDIYSNGTLTQKPSKASTAQESYVFGSLDEFTGDYIPYSGWKLSTSSRPLSEDGMPVIHSNTIIEAYFNAIPRSYYVVWYLDEAETQVVKRSTAAVAYGEGYTLEAPTIQDIHNAGYETCSINIANGTATYSYVTGWEKLPTNINPSATDTQYNIHAIWEHGEVGIDTLFSNDNLDNLTPLQLLVLSGMSSEVKNNYNITSKVGVGTRMTYTMGADNNVSGTELISTPLRLDAATSQSRATTIQPLRVGNDAFTLAIDYCFNADQLDNIETTYSTLVSCYYSNMTTDVRNGFSLFYGHAGNISGPRIGFGDMYNISAQSKVIGSASRPGLRNIIVLRHPANSPILYFYSGLSNGSANIPSQVYTDSLTWANYNSDAYINFGQVGNDADPNDGTPASVSNGKGTIFWAKYWPEDLGQGECKRIAMWPHEPVTFAITALSNNATNSTRASANNGSGSISLATLTASSHIRLTNGRQQNISTYGWTDFIARDICNNRIALGLPIALQSILCKAQTSYSVGIMTVDEQAGNSYGIRATASQIRDYARLYGVQNVGNTNSIYNIEQASPFTWYDSSNVIVYTQDTQSTWVANENYNNREKYINIRFPMKAIEWGVLNNRLRIFQESTAVPSTTTIAATITSAVDAIRSGDIYINTSGDAYMYVTTAEITNLGLQTISSSVDRRFASDTIVRGGWIKAEDYWTRSVITANGFNFADVSSVGDVNTSNISNASSAGLNLCYSIMI